MQERHTGNTGPWYEHTVPRTITYKQSCGSGFSYGSGFKWFRTRIQGFDDQKLERKKYSRNLYIFFFIKIYNLLMSQLQEKPSALKREHPALQKIKLISFFLCLWVILALPDPDSDWKTESGYGFRDPIESRSGSTALTIEEGL